MRKPETTAPVDLLEQMGYETRDIALGTILRWISFLFVFIVLTLLGSTLVYSFFVPKDTEIGRSSPLKFQRSLPPNPQLQAFPKHDMMVWRQAEDSLIAGKAPDPMTGKTVIPIDEAVNILATQRGIAGVKGDTIRQRPNGYPGSGLYETGPTRSNNTGADDMSSPDVGNKATQSGEPGVGGTDVPKSGHDTVNTGPGEQPLAPPGPAGAESAPR